VDLAKVHKTKKQKIILNDNLFIGIYSVDFANLSNRFSITGGDGLTFICSVS
jgi:hypothetical protein